MLHVPWRLGPTGPWWRGAIEYCKWLKSSNSHYLYPLEYIMEVAVIQRGCLSFIRIWMLLRVDLKIDGAKYRIFLKTKTAKDHNRLES